MRLCISFAYRCSRVSTYSGRISGAARYTLYFTFYCGLPIPGVEKKPRFVEYYKRKFRRNGLFILVASVRRLSKNRQRYIKRGRLSILYFCLRRDVYRYSSKTPSLHSYASIALCSRSRRQAFGFQNILCPPCICFLIFFFIFKYVQFRRDLRTQIMH